MPKKETKETKESSEKGSEEKKTSPKKSPKKTTKKKDAPPAKNLREYTIAKDLPKKLQPESNKRKSRKVEKFDIVPTSTRETKEVVIQKGKGTKLENVSSIAAQIKKRPKSDDLLGTLHSVLYGRITKDTDAKENLLKFSGVVYEDDEKGRRALENKLNGYMLKPLRALAALLGRDPDGDREELVQSIADYLEKPKDFEKTYPIPGEKKKRKRSSSRSSSPRRSKSPRKKKQKKDKNAPKRALSAYLFFCNDKRPELKKKYPDEAITQLAARLGKAWGKLSESDKKPYNKEAEKDKERYEKEMKKYEKKKADKKE